MTTGTARFEWLSRAASGAEVPLEVFLTRIRMGEKDIIQAVINDISKRKQAEAELVRALAREKELSALKTNFVSMVSHEFRTPLAIIMSSAEILADYFEALPAEERKHHLTSIHGNTRRMADMMEDVLMIGRLDSGKLAFQPCALDLGVLCRRIVDEVLSVTEKRCPIELRLEGLEDTAQADEPLLQHIFGNLLSNAVKYSPAGSPVDFSVRRDGGQVACVIRDHGIGIPEADQPRVFQAFHRGDNVGERSGTGLGLVIVKRCVELHGGTIRLESHVGQGTTVSLTLPLFPQSTSTSNPTP